MNLLTCWSSLFALLVTVAANTEKVIFTAPGAITQSEANPSLDSLQLQGLSPDAYSLRTAISVQFLNESEIHKSESWYIVDNLAEGQRYEIRVCWAAIQPTAFDLDVFNLTHVFEAPELIQSLASFSEFRIEALPDLPNHDLKPRRRNNKTTLFLRIRSSADFFTSQRNLMLSPPPVHVDLILDPYLGNILPQSLITTLAYIAILVLASVSVSKVVWKRLQASIKQHSD